MTSENAAVAAATGPKVAEGEGFYAPTGPVTTVAGQFQRDHERDMADPEYAAAYKRQVQHMADHLAFRLLPVLILACLGVVIWGVVSALT